MQQAAVEAARRRINRAAGLLREAGAELAALAADDVETVGSLRVHDNDSLQEAIDLVARGLLRHRTVDVVVIARPRRRRPPTTAPRVGAKGNTHATSNARAAPT